MFSIADSRVASEARANLPKHVDTAKLSSPSEEHELIEAAGQVLDFAMTGVDDENLIEYSATGSSTPSTGDRYFNVTLKSRAIRTNTQKASEPRAPWTPAQGPLARRSSDRTRTSEPTSAGATSADDNGQVPAATPERIAHAEGAHDDAALVAERFAAPPDVEAGVPIEESAAIARDEAVAEKPSTTRAKTR